MCEITSDGAAIHLFLMRSPQNVSKIAHVTFAKCAVPAYSSVLSVGSETSHDYSGVFHALLSPIISFKGIGGKCEIFRKM
jgi:hypothetical protein